TGDSRRLLKEAERCVRSLEREQVSSAAAAALLVRAGVACTRGQVEETGTLAEAAAAAFEACGALHNAAAARWLLGHALGGTAGDRVRADATAWMAAQGARAPDRMLSMLAPARFS
ncbi:MAG TPA: hypothetical protein VMN60_05355, partial [Longimicrobiales bacterium]|nr:hypothetical protein [Longimicrobiales bacterium]